MATAAVLLPDWSAVLASVIGLGVDGAEVPLSARHDRQVCASMYKGPLNGVLFPSAPLSGSI